MKRLKLSLCHAMYQRMLKRKYSAFMRGVDRAESYQNQYLNDIITKNSGTAYGREHHFRQVKTAADYRNAIPLVTYDDVKPCIDRMMDGEQNILFHEPLTIFEKTSGSTAPSKYIPFNRSFLAEINEAASAWIFDIYFRFKTLRKSTAFWAISPRLGDQDCTKGGTKIGFADDSEYFSPVTRLFLKQLLSVDPSVGGLSENRFREEVALSLASDEHLGLVSIWNPTLFLLLLEYIDAEREPLLQKLYARKKRIGTSRLKRIEHLFNHDGPVDFQALWPNLELISCWTDGSATLFLPSLTARFPDVSIQGKGLMMTEGVISIPLEGFSAPILSICSHYFEFIELHDEADLDVSPHSATLLPHELETGKDYIPVITTRGGLYRYMTGDRIRVDGFYKSVPLIRFMGRLNQTVDLCGEKLTESFVESLLSDIVGKYGLTLQFMMMAPVLLPKPHYVLFIESTNGRVNDTEIADDLEKGLMENHHYRLCRMLGQLDGIDVLNIQNGKQTYVNTLMGIKKQKYGHIKNRLLDSNLFWKDHFRLAANHWN